MEIGLVLNVIDSCIPSDLGTGMGRSRGRHRCVAMTRARITSTDHAATLLPHQQVRRPPRMPRTPSSQGHLDRFESCAWPGAGAGTAGNRSTGEPVDIAMRLRRMWG